MNPLKKAIEEVKYRIPRQLLEKVFVAPLTNWRATRSNLDDQILSLVVSPRVMVDCNLKGGKEALIPLRGLEFQMPEMGISIVHIPKDRTEGKSINSVLSLVYFDSPGAFGGSFGANTRTLGANYAGGIDSTATMTVALNAMRSQDTIPVVSTSKIKLISENTILVKDQSFIPSNSAVRCILAEDENLSGLNLRSYHAFAKLVEYAVKSYIYNELVISIDESQLLYGQAIGAFKDVFMGYADAEQNYQDYLIETWEKVAFMDDENQHTRYLKLLIGGAK